MADNTLQKILLVEDELFQAEQVEQEKLADWIKEQKKSISLDLESRIEILLNKKQKILARELAKVNSLSTQTINEAEKKAAELDVLEKSELKEIVRQGILEILRSKS